MQKLRLLNTKIPLTRPSAPSTHPIAPFPTRGRRYLDLYRAHLSDLGGEEGLSEARRSLCRRAAALETELERMECRMAADMQVDLDRYGRAAGNLRRILESIGLDRRTKDVTPVSLQEYLEYRAKAEPKT